ncbi:gag-pol polyprotein [Tanacetum coccineum]
MLASESHIVVPVCYIGTFEENFKVDAEMFNLIKINDNLFTYNTPLGVVFDEFKRLSSMEDDLFTYELGVVEDFYFPCVEQSYDERELNIYEARVCHDECEKIYAEAVILINKILVRLIDITVEQWLDLKYSDHKMVDKDIKDSVISTWLIRNYKKQFDEYMEIKRQLEVYGLYTDVECVLTNFDFAECLNTAYWSSLIRRIGSRGLCGLWSLHSSTVKFQLYRPLMILQKENEAIHLLLTRIGDEIYSNIDDCKTCYDIWIAIERLQQGESLNIQDVKTNLFSEFGQNSFLRLEKQWSLTTLDFTKKPKRESKLIGLEDMDEEIDEQELEAHYSYMVKIHEVHTVDSRTNTDPLEKGRYAQWQSRFLRYIIIRPNGDALRKCILKSPYTPSTVIILAVPATDDSPEVLERIAMMNEMIETLDVVLQVNVQFLQQLQPEWSRFVKIVKQQHDLDTVSYHKLFDTLKQYQKEVNEIRAERIAKNANPLALVIAKPITPPSESASEEDSDPEQAQKDKEMQKNLALIAKETIGSQVVQQTGIQCFNCKDFGYFAKECRKPKRVKDSTYHKEKMLLCKQAQKGVPLQADQSDWIADTDEEIDEQELEAHYNYMEKIQEVPTADSGTDTEPLEQVQYNPEYNVFANERQHSEQPESISNTCVVEKVDSNVILDSPDMCDNDIQSD